MSLYLFVLISISVSIFLLMGMIYIRWILRRERHRRRDLNLCYLQRYLRVSNDDWVRVKDLYDLGQRYAIYEDIVVENSVKISDGQINYSRFTFPINLCNFSRPESLTQFCQDVVRMVFVGGQSRRDRRMANQLEQFIRVSSDVQRDDVIVGYDFSTRCFKMYATSVNGMEGLDIIFEGELMYNVRAHKRYEKRILDDPMLTMMTTIIDGIKNIPNSCEWLKAMINSRHLGVIYVVKPNIYHFCLNASQRLKIDLIKELSGHFNVDSYSDIGTDFRVSVISLATPPDDRELKSLTLYGRVDDADGFRSKIIDYLRLYLGRVLM